MITLIGHGYLGTQIGQELTSQEFKFYWIKHTDKIPKNTKIIINAAGFTGIPNVDACETARQKTVDGNILFPYKLELENRHTPIIHITSGCIYTGYEKPEGYNEIDPINFNFDNGSFYSAVKGLSQQILEPFMNKSYLFRIRMPFGSKAHPKNLITKILNYPKLINVENSLTNIEDLGKVVAHFIKVRPNFGIYNLTNPGSITTKEIASLLGVGKQWITIDELEKFTVAPRSNCVLDSSKLQSVYPMPSAIDSLKNAIKNYTL